ncbi:MAG: hypothetical protein M3327_04545 [Actinomycetota bacterium]|nr:hypothetical protein [Actinomycetota bacterium]
MRLLPVSRARLAIATAVVLVAAGAVSAAVALRSGDEPSRQGHAAHVGSAADPHPVAGHFKPDDTGLAECTSGERHCYEQAFGNLAYEKGPREAIAEFDRAMQTNKAVEADCHRIVHTIGSAALARFHGNVAKAFALGSASCWSGYYHGILERAFTGVSGIDELGEAARRICDDPGIRRTTFLAYQCVHGLGHGLMIRSGYDLPFSLSICDRLATEWDQTSCTGGVFMENISSTYGVKSKWLRDDDPVYPCQVVKERHKLYCYLMVTSRVSELNGYDWRRTAEVCRRVERDWVATCFESYGRDASGSTRQSPRDVVRLCRFAGEHAVSCVYGAVRDMTSNYANGRRASELCRLVGRSLRPHCYYGIGTILGNLASTEQGRRRSCRSVTPRAYLDSCLGGAGVRVAGVVQSPA